MWRRWNATRLHARNPQHTQQQQQVVEAVHRFSDLVYFKHARNSSLKHPGLARISALQVYSYTVEGSFIPIEFTHSNHFTDFCPMQSSILAFSLVTISWIAKSNRDCLSLTSQFDFRVCSNKIKIVQCYDKTHLKVTTINEWKRTWKFPFRICSKVNINIMFFICCLRFVTYIDE